MQFTLTALVLAASASIVSAQGLTTTVAPTAAAPSGCATDYPSPFEFAVVLPPTVASTKRSVDNEIFKRQSIECAGDGTLVATLSGGILTDSEDRIGGIVSNHQFQFDGPVSQSGTIYNAGFSICSNGSLALGGSNIFYQCPTNGDSTATGAGSYNLYDEPVGDTSECQEVLIMIVACYKGTSTSTAAAATSTGTTSSLNVVGLDGSTATAATAAGTTATAAAGTGTTTKVVTTAVVSQKSDGQILGTSASITATTTAAAAVAVMSQKTDGQILGPKATTAAAVVVSSSVATTKVATTLATAASTTAIVIATTAAATTAAVTTAAAGTTSAAAATTTTSLNVIPIGATTTSAAKVTTNAASSAEVGPSFALAAFAVAAFFLLG